MLSYSIRSFDMAFRNDKDEFSITLPNCSVSAALEVADRMQKEVEVYPFQISKKRRIHLTGPATYPGSNHQQMIHQADKALYSKAFRKNQVYPAKTSSPRE
ncbi:diguanylate cyclase domain-containing protein [Oceanobacillus sp. CFH 90083]|uniref:GGDEF domain-containing protein n=1 Tax=Oceanobacillus sp. CFH 90083 TaxID=2592336 RepID=UPI001D137047|nr:diguanylate cyclase [Oceanobacillus sp. CFH 90083]